jgi:hypothetical protein
MNYNQISVMIRELLDASDHRLSMVKAHSNDLDYTVNMTTASVLSDLAKVLIRVRKEMPTEFNLATKRNLSSPEGDPQPS